MEKENSTETLVHLIRELNVPVTRASIRQELELHPEHPSLLAISDVLKQWNISNAAYEVSFMEISEVPCPFVVQLAKGEFAVVNSITPDNAVLSNDKWDKHVLHLDEFKKLYGGNIMLAEAGQNAGEPDYQKKERQELLNDLRLPLLFTGLIIVLLSGLGWNTSYLSALSWQTALLSLFKSIGLVTTVLLLIQSIDANNGLIQRLCTGKKNDCNAILSSKVAKIAEELSWSELGFFYFAGTWLTLMFNTNSEALMQSLAFINLLCLPYTVYSLYYQYQKKQWCILCCTIQALFWLEFFAFLPYFFNAVSAPAPNEWAGLIFCMVSPVLLWAFMKPYLLKDTQLQPLRKQLKRFKYSTDVFNKLLESQPNYMLPDEEHSLTLGNREAEIIITMVSNPYCQPCAKAHKTLEEWLAGRDDIQLRIVFTARNEESDKKTEIARHLMGLKEQEESIIKKALHDWYEQKQKSYQTWAAAYPVKNNIDLNETLEAQKAWCNMAEITGTPTIFLNGYRLPKPYQLEDIKYFI